MERSKHSQEKLTDKQIEDILNNPDDYTVSQYLIARAEKLWQEKKEPGWLRSIKTV